MTSSDVGPYLPTIGPRIGPSIVLYSNHRRHLIMLPCIKIKEWALSGVEKAYYSWATNS